MSCPPTPLLRSNRFRSAVEVAEGLVRLVQSALEDPRVRLGPPDLPDLRAMLVNADPLDQKALEVFRVPLDLLAVALEEPRYLAQKDLGVLLALPDLKATMVFLALPDPRAITVQSDPLALLDRRVLPDLLENVVPQVRMRSPRSSTDTSPRTRQLRHTVRRPMSKTRSDRPTHSRTVLVITLQ